jgi:hypothetical protein
MHEYSITLYDGSQESCQADGHFVSEGLLVLYTLNGAVVAYYPLKDVMAAVSYRRDAAVQSAGSPNSNGRETPPFSAGGGTFVRHRRHFTN